MLDEPSRGDEDVVFVRDLEDLGQRALGHQRERPAGELQRVHVLAHRLEYVAQVARAHRRVVRPPDLGDASGPGFLGAPVGGQERKGTLDGSRSCRSIGGHLVSNQSVIPESKRVSSPTDSSSRLATACLIRSAVGSDLPFREPVELRSHRVPAHGPGGEALVVVLLSLQDLAVAQVQPDAGGVPFGEALG